MGLSTKPVPSSDGRGWPCGQLVLNDYVVRSLGFHDIFPISSRQNLIIVLPYKSTLEQQTNINATITVAIVHVFLSMKQGPCAHVVCLRQFASFPTYTPAVTANATHAAQLIAHGTNFAATAAICPFISQILFPNFHDWKISHWIESK